MNIIDNDKGGVVSTNINNEIEIWKNIPGYTFKRYSVSNIGNIRKEKELNKFTNVKQWECKTSVGTYLNVTIINDSGISKIRGVHQFVCLAFHGEPPNDGLKYEVNHIDGNKHNNRADNLEWMTRKENTLHALKSGLRNDNVPVEVYDATTNQWTKYYSIIELSRTWNMPRNDIKKLIARYSDKFYLDRWKFKIDRDKLGKINRDHHEEIFAYDHVDNKLILANNATDMYYTIGVHSTTILERLRKNIFTMIGGYSFRYRDKINHEKPIFLKHTKKEAELSRNAYFNKKDNEKNLPYLMKNYITNEIKEYSSLKEMAEKENTTYQKLIDYVCDKNELNIRKGKAFKKKNDLRQWREYDKETIEKSLSMRIFVPRKIQANTTC